MVCRPHSGDYHIAGTFCGRKFCDFINKQKFCCCNFTIPSTCNAFLGPEHQIFLPSGMPSVIPNINDSRVRNAAELTDDLFV